MEAFDVNTAGPLRELVVAAPGETRAASTRIAVRTVEALERLERQMSDTSIALGALLGATGVRDTGHR